MDYAADHLHAALVERTFHGWRRLRFWVLALVAGAFGHEGPAVFDLVVTRTATGAEIMRTRADLGDPEALLEQVQEDLATKTVIEFLAEWRIIE